MLNYTRSLLNFRRGLTSLVAGDTRMLDAPEGVLAFVRSHGDDQILCVFNLGDHASHWSPPANLGKAVMVANQANIDITEDVPDRLDPMTGYWALVGREGA